VDPQTGTIKVRLLFPNPAFLLRAGMSSNVLVRNEDTADVFLIPGKAVTEQMGEYFVYVAKDTIIPHKGPGKPKEEGKIPKPSLHALQKKVTVGQTIADKIIVKTGLRTGDNIVTDGIQKLHDGSKITTTNVMTQPPNGRK
jgi:membrane fusion protein (multidrug efflux system)